MNIIADSDLLKKDPEATLVIDKLKCIGLPVETIVYYKFPLYSGDLEDSIVQAHVLCISPKHGVLCFLCKGQKTVSLSLDEKDKQDEVYLNIEKRLKMRKELRQGLNLKIPLNLFVINGPTRKEDEIDYIDINDIRNCFSENTTDLITSEIYNIIQECIEGTGRITRKKERKQNVKSNSKADILNKIQNEEAVFDFRQKEVALQIIDGPQRIRGLAGSGKTIVLAMKAALYHLSNPNAHILYTYYTKSLHDTIRNLIDRFYKGFSDNQAPDWEKIHILHGWGGIGVSGVYSTACDDNNVFTVPFSIAKYKRPSDPFGYVCEDLIKSVTISPAYDLTLIDEGQDFPSSFYKLCFHLTKNRKVVWAYDDFQNIFDIQIQNEKETFGKDENGEYLIDFSNPDNQNPYQDIVLKKCYRTPREVLIAAFSLGLGIYNKQQVLQRLEDNSHWESLGFVVEQGDSRTGSQMIIDRPTENSTSVMNQNFNENALKVEQFNDWEEECEYVIRQIIRDINEEDLRPDDICVICLKNRAMETYYNRISSQLMRHDIRCFNLLTVPNTNIMFNREGEVTLSTINKAKGNEAGMIYILGVDSVFANPNHVVARNRLFTAMTRAKGWVTLTGSEDLSSLKDELNSLKNNGFKLNFTQPSKESTKTIENVSRSQQKGIDDIHNIIKKLTDSGLTLDAIKKMLGLNEQG